MDPSLLPEAAALVSHIALHSSVAALQMFVASGGLPLLVAMLYACDDSHHNRHYYDDGDDDDDDIYRRKSSSSSRAMDSSSREVSSLDGGFELSRVAVDALLRVLLLRGTIPTNDMCRLLAVQLQLLPPLAAVWRRCLDACAASMASLSRGGGSSIEKDVSVGKTQRVVSQPDRCVGNLLLHNRHNACRMPFLVLRRQTFHHRMNHDSIRV